MDAIFTEFNITKGQYTDWIAGMNRAKLAVERMSKSKSPILFQTIEDAISEKEAVNLLFDSKFYTVEGLITQLENISSIGQLYILYMNEKETSIELLKHTVARS